MKEVLTELSESSDAAKRMDELVRAVGGPSEASRITGKTRTTIDNWRRKGSADFLDILPLIQAAGASLDWLATGFGVPPVLAVGANKEGKVRRGLVQLSAFTELPNYQSGEPILGLPRQTIDSLGVPLQELAAAPVSDGGLAPLIRRGGIVIVAYRPIQPTDELVLVAGEWPIVRRYAVDTKGKPALIADAMPNWSMTPAEMEEVQLYPVVWSGGAV